MQDEPPGTERAIKERDCVENPATRHSWPRTQRNTPGSTKQAEVVETRNVGVESAMPTRTATHCTTCEQHGDGVSDNEGDCDGRQRTPCQPRYRGHHGHGAGWETNLAEMANFALRSNPASQMGRRNAQVMVGTHNRATTCAQQSAPFWTTIRTCARRRHKHQVQRSASHVGGSVRRVQQPETTR